MRPFRVGFLSVYPALALIVASAAAAAGQERDTTQVDSTRTFRVEGVTVRVARPILTAGGTSAVRFDLDSMAPPPAPTMEEVLRAMPLIQIRRNSRGEAQPALRGSEDRQIAILMDGVPLTLGWDHRTDLSIIPLTAATNVTLVRGLSSVLYGPNTLGGVVEVDVGATGERITAVDPWSAALGLDHTGATQLSLSGGRVVEGAFGQWVVRAGVGFEDRPGFALPGGAKRDADLRPRFLGDGDIQLNTDARRIDGFVTTRYRADDGRWLSLSTSGYTLERGVAPEAHQDEPRLWRYPLQRRFVTALAGGTGHRPTPWGEGDVELSVGLDVGRTEIDQFETEAYRTVVEEEDADDRTATLRLLAEHTLGANADLRVAGTYGDVTHDEVLTPGGMASYRQRLWSVGVESEWRLVGGRGRINAGAAVDGADTPESGDKPPLGSLTDVAGRLGASFLLNPGTRIHMGISRRARFPSLRELYSGALGRFEPNPGLRPEVLLGGEAGLTLRRGTGDFQAVVFHQRLTDGIVRRSFRDEAGNRKFQRVNQDEVRSTGLELLATASLGRTVLSGDLTLQSVRGFDPDGTERELEYEPEIMGRASATVPFASWEAGGTLRFVGSQRCENPETGGLQPLRGTSVVDATLRRVFSFGRGGRLRSVDAMVGVGNVLDQVSFDQCGLPQPGRTFRVQLRLR